MSLRSPIERSRQREPAIGLINVVFLMLIFFLIAGTVAPQADGELSLVEDVEAAQAAYPDATVVLPDGRMLLRGTETTIAAVLAEGAEVQLIPDRNLPAQRLVALARSFQDAGASEVWIVAERGGS